MNTSPDINRDQARSQLDPKALETFMKFAANFKYFARENIKIEGFNPGEVLNLEFNPSQLILDLAVNMMLAELGWVRIIIVKGRQQGISTYIEMRLFWKAYFNPNTKICVIAHEAKAAKGLFNKAAFALANLPDALKVKPLTDNKSELELPNKSVYAVLTAGSEESGRSQTAHHQHQSERAFFLNHAKIDAGAGQIVATVRGTEVYKESTANGWNHFRREVFEALEGKGLFRVVFIPWYIDAKNSHPVKADFKPDETEIQLMEMYNLTPGQIQFRRDKIVELHGENWFKQEYPFELEEAFQSAAGAFFDSMLVAKARRSESKGIGPKILGVDPARGGDRTVITLRQGCEVIKFWKYHEMDPIKLGDIIANIIRDEQIDKCFIDWAEGSGTIAWLRKLKFGHIVEGVNFGDGASDDVYLNKRAEMAFAVDAWLRDGSPNLPNDDDMSADFGSMPAWEKSTYGKIKFPDKKEIKKSYGKSPDILDSIMLTFAYPVRDTEADKERGAFGEPIERKRKSTLSAMRDKRGEN